VSGYLPLKVLSGVAREMWESGVVDFGAVMFCPECKAEYRQGFTHCADCDVDLVATQQEAMRTRSAVEENASDNLAMRVWHGTDPHFYVGVMEYLETKGMYYRGRPLSPPPFGSFEDEPIGAFANPEFEIRVSKENFPLANWMLRSWKEKYDETEIESTRIAEGSLEEFPEYEEEASEAQSKEETERKSECPLCAAEFEPEVMICPNCKVHLQSADDKKAGRNSGRALCSLKYPNFYGPLRKALVRAGIPFDNAMFPKAWNSRRPGVSVLSSDFERATDVMAQLLKYWEFGQGIATPSFEDPREAYWPARAKDSGWFPEDLTALVWQGTNFLTLDFVGMTLREHDIAYRVESSEPGDARVFVHPEDEVDGRAILNEVVEDGNKAL
jgi:hypothetical protein